MNIGDSPRRDGLQANSSQPAQAPLSNELRQRLAGLAGSAADEVSLSNLSAALSAAGNNSALPTARLAEISAAAANQSYQIDIPAISQSIISQHLRA
jgi:hypothetical protein